MWAMTEPLALAERFVQGWGYNPIRFNNLIEDICWDSREKELLSSLRLKNQSFFSGWYVEGVPSRTTGGVFW